MTKYAPPITSGTIQLQDRCCVQLVEREIGIRYGARIIALAYRHSVADYSSKFGCSVGCRVNAMSEPEQREIAETVFEQTREEIRDAIRLEEERRAALAKTCTA